MTAAQVVMVYEVAGAAWVTFNLTLQGEIADRMRERLREQWKERPALTIVLLILWNQLWPLAAAVALVPRTWFPRAWDAFGRWARREYLDRPGLLEPAMPAPRCPMHDIALDTVRVTCCRCARLFDVGHCGECCVGGCPIECGGWVCPYCRGLVPHGQTPEGAP